MIRNLYADKIFCKLDGRQKTKYFKLLLYNSDTETKGELVVM